MKRLKGCQQNVEVWQRILKVRALVVAPKDDMTMWIKFASLCRKSGRNGLSLKVLATLLGSDPSQEDNLVCCYGETLTNQNKGAPKVVYSYLKHLWQTGGKDEAYRILKEFTFRLADELDAARRNVDYTDDPKFHGKVETDIQVLARCFLKLGEWQQASQESLDEVSMSLKFG
jgi:FKBP12-rapamycin complex-associated protein